MWGSRGVNCSTLIRVCAKLIISHEFSRIIRVRCEASLVKLSAMLLRGSGKRKLDFGEYRSIRNQVELNLIYLENCSTHSGVGSANYLTPIFTRSYCYLTPAGVLGVFSYDRISKIADNKTNLYE